MVLTCGSSLIMNLCRLILWAVPLSAFCFPAARVSLSCSAECTDRLFARSTLCTVGPFLIFWAYGQITVLLCSLCCFWSSSWVFVLQCVWCQVCSLSLIGLSITNTPTMESNKFMFPLKSLNLHSFFRCSGKMSCFQPLQRQACGNPFYECNITPQHFFRVLFWLWKKLEVFYDTIFTARIGLSCIFLWPCYAASYDEYLGSQELIDMSILSFSWAVLH